jgi:hypothetical protein
MLAENVLKENDVVTIKLLSGEEMIAKYVSQTETVINFSKPAVLAQGANGMVLAPYVMTAEKTDIIPILKTALVTMPLRTQTAIAASYTELTSGIKKASSMPEVPPGLIIS